VCLVLLGALVLEPSWPALVKVAVALAIVVTFADYARERPAEGALVFAGVMAGGLGPATNNFLVFILGL
jgi:uncharacterized membrane protein